MIASFARALEGLSNSQRSRDGIVALAVPAPVVRPVRLVAACADHDATLLWDALPRAQEEPVAIVGFGETVRIEGHGSDRLSQIVVAAQSIWASLTKHGDLEAPGPYFVGGLSFRVQPPREPWLAFADASFSLPRWSYVRRGSQAWWWSCLRSDEVAGAHSEVLAEFERLIRAASLAGRTQPDQRERRTSIARVDAADRDEYCALVADAIACIQTRVTDKIVAVASSRVTFSEPIDTALVLERLDANYPDTTRFAVKRGDRVFVGASPERLVARSGLQVDSDALAGTARRTVDDEATCRTLLTNSKERREHALVVESIASVLGSYCSSLDLEESPRIRSLRNVHHLWTPVQGVLREQQHVLKLVDALHPTPAVAGTPKDRATAWIAEHERTARGWYTGAVGYFDAVGDGDFAVAIRAGLVGRDAAYLYAGAGIVEASDPPAEYAETRAKEAPMLAALGVAP